MATSHEASGEKRRRNSLKFRHMDWLDLDNVRIAYGVRGTGPPLLAPECNYTWSSVVEEQLAQQFTLIVASPRDYGPSTRTGGPEPGSTDLGGL